MTLMKIDIAEVQLDHAIQLYLDDQDLISAVTLAGAAEEILGKLVRERGGIAALDETAQQLCQLHESVFDEKVDPKVFVGIRNRARNECKHIGSMQLRLDPEREAANIIRRAINNYRKLSPKRVRLFRNFECTFLERRRGLKALIVRARRIKTVHCDGYRRERN